MHLMRIFYVLVFFGTIAYFFLYGIITNKIPIITIHFEKEFEIQRQPNENKPKPFTSGQEENAEISSKDVETVKPTSKKNVNFKDGYGETVTNEFWDFLENFKKNKSEMKLAMNPTKQESEPTKQDSEYESSRQTDSKTLVSLIEGLDNELGDAPVELKELEKCIYPKRVGRLYFNKWERFTMSQIEDELKFVNKGGKWKPETCQAKSKVAIVIPFRDRQEHLVTFLRHMHRFMKWQLLDYRIFIIEQLDSMPFNRGMLMNVGFQEAMKADIYDCAIFHDIDLIPEDDRNDYSCPSSPRHMSTAVDTMKYKLGYKKLFGGVEAFWPEHYRKVNGFPNRYWGWGGEDDDLYLRIVEHSLTLTRPAHQIGRYTMLKHGHKKSDKNPDRHAQLQQSQMHLKTDGLSVLKYDVISSVEHPLYTMVGVKLGEKRWSLFG